MALPVSWTEPSLVAALEAELEPVLAPLKLDTMDVLVTAVGANTPAVLGVASVAAVTYASVADVVKVLVIATWQAWQKAVDAASTKYDLASGTSNLKRSQVWQQLSARLATAERAARRYPEAAVLLGGPHRPKVGQIAKTAPATPLYPPDPNSPVYSGRPAGWWP